MRKYKNDKQLHILKITADGIASVIDIPNTLQAMQEIVGGYIEAVYIGMGVNVICNEEGTLLRLPYNEKAVNVCGGFSKFHTRLFGTVFFVGAASDRFKSLDDMQIKELLKYLEVVR